MAKNQNTFAKLLREREKKRKADDKRKRREERKLQAQQPEPERDIYGNELSDEDSASEDDADPAPESQSD